MGREIQRAFLWMIFLLGLFMLWDAWQVRNGNPSFFGTPAPVQEQVAEGNAPSDVNAPVATTGSQAVASEVNVTITKPVEVTTDLFKITFDANGASVAKAELLKERQTPDWKTRGLPGLIFGSSEDKEQELKRLEHAYRQMYEDLDLESRIYPNHEKSCASRIFVIQ